MEIDALLLNKKGKIMKSMKKQYNSKKRWQTKCFMHH